MYYLLGDEITFGELHQIPSNTAIIGRSMLDKINLIADIRLPSNTNTPINTWSGFFYFIFFGGGKIMSS